MAKKIPLFISEKILFASQLTATWQAIAQNTLLGIDPSTNLPKSLFDIGDLTEISGGSMLNDVIARNDGELKVYDASALPVGSIAWEDLLSAGTTTYPDGYIKGFLPSFVSGGEDLSFSGGKCRNSDNTTNFDCSSLGQKDLTATWDEGFGAHGAMIGGNGLRRLAPAMTSDSAPSPELCFATNYQTSANPFYAFDHAQIVLRGSGQLSYESSTTPSGASPVYLGRKNTTIGTLKGISIAASTILHTIKDFEIVGTNDTITDQSSFDSATWTTIASFTDEPNWISGEERWFDCSSNTTSYGWYGIKVTSCQDASGSPAKLFVQELRFYAHQAINALYAGLSYHCFVLYNPIADTYDWCVDVDPDGGNILSNSAITAAGYTKFRRIWSFVANSSNLLEEFTCKEVFNGSLDVSFNIGETLFLDDSDSGIIVIVDTAQDVEYSLRSYYLVPKLIDLYMKMMVSMGFNETGYAAVVYKTSNQTLTVSTLTQLTGWTIHEDDHGIYSSSDNAFKIKEDGWYVAFIQARWSVPSTSGTIRTIYIVANKIGTGDTTVARETFYDASTTYRGMQCISVPIKLVKDELVKIKALYDDGSGVYLYGDGTADQTVFSLIKLSGTKSGVQGYNVKASLIGNDDSMDDTFYADNPMDTLIDAENSPQIINKNVLTSDSAAKIYTYPNNPNNIYMKAAIFGYIYLRGNE